LNRCNIRRDIHRNCIDGVDRRQISVIGAGQEAKRIKSAEQTRFNVQQPPVIVDRQTIAGCVAQIDTYDRKKVTNGR
jgi:hypothetical protein